MASPLGLTTFKGVLYNDDGSGVDDTTNYSSRYNSLFNNSKFYYRPPKASQDDNGVTNIRSSKIHQAQVNGDDDLYNISTNSIIDYTNRVDNNGKYPMRLTPSDFAYLRDLGVYPNNRLAVVRRFASPVENDLTAVGMNPISKIVTWIPDDLPEFMSFSLGEGWQENDEYNLVELFDGIFKQSTGMSLAGAAAGAKQGSDSIVPFPGVSDAIQISIMNYMLGDENGTGTNFRYDNLPTGNPNFLHKSSYRPVNSLQSEISFELKAVYEQKFINGVDPTIVFLDLIGNMLRFASSESIFYISQSGSKKINEFFNSYANGDWISAIEKVLDAIIRGIKSLGQKVGTTIKKLKDKNNDTTVGSLIKNTLNVIGSSVMAKYRIHFSRVLPALTGASSAPWHITIGNPKKPFFSSGDMIVEGTKVSFGNTLAFNEIPNRVEISFTVKSARPLGIQEIFDKFNIGAGREYQRATSTQNGVFSTDGDYYQGSVYHNRSENITNTPVTGAGS